MDLRSFYSLERHDEVALHELERLALEALIAAAPRTPEGDEWAALLDEVRRELRLRRTTH